MGEVLEQWPNMFHILGLIRTCTLYEFFFSLYSQISDVTVEGRSEAEATQAKTSASAGNRLVRVPIEELASTTNSSG
jgi:hypothetical protein